MANEISLLAAELFVDDRKAEAVLNAFPNLLRKTQTDIDKIGDRSNFGRGITSQLDEVERRAAKTSSLLAGAFSPENIIKGAAFTTAVKFLSDSTRAAFDAEKANRLLSSSATEAGKAYSELAEANVRFARDAGLARTEAASSTAKIQQLANATGQPQDLERLQKSFLDLGAARGIAGDDLETLIGTILSGQDEGLNRLGLSDPSKLQAVYADQIGKTVEQLTQQEKTQAAVNAITEKAAIFTGANAEKMASLSGQSERASATISDLYTSFGEGLTGTLEFRNALTLTNDLLSAVTTNISEIQKKLKEGISPRDLAIQEGNKPANQILDAVGDFLSPVGALGGAVYDAFAGASTTEAVDNFIASLGGTHKRRVDALEKNFTAEQKVVETQEKAAQDQTKIREEKRIGQERKAESERKARESARLAERLIETKGSLEELRKLQSGLDKTIIGEKSFDSQNDKIGDYIREQVESGKEKVKDLEKSALSAFDTIAGKVAQDNPFVKVTNDYDQALTKLRENTRGLTGETREWLEALLSRQSQVELFGARLDTALKALDLRDDAERFRNASESQKEIDERNNRYLQSDPNNAGNAYNRKLLSDGKPYDPARVRADLSTYASIQSLTEAGYNPSDFSGFLARRNRQIAGADDAGTVEEKLNRQLETVEKVRARSLNGDSELAFEINAQTDRKIIALTQSLDPSKLSSRQREEAASAREREATRIERTETEAQGIEKSKIAAINELKTNVARLVAIAEKEGAQGIIRIIDETGGSVKTEVKTPTAKDTAQSYGLRVSTLGNRLSNF